MVLLQQFSHGAALVCSLVSQSLYRWWVIHSSPMVTILLRTIIKYESDNFHVDWLLQVGFPY